MTEKEQPVNQYWLVQVAGYGELRIFGAYPQWHPSAGTVHALGDGNLTLVTIKDADHKIVFQAPAQAVAYVLREGEQVGVPIVQLPAGIHATDGQIADLQAALDAAVHPRKVILQQNHQPTELRKAHEDAAAVRVTMNTAIPGAAGGSQTLNVAFPSEGMR